jgi:hypothetical protein
MLAIIRELPNHISILAIARVEVLDSRERGFRDVGVVSAKKIAVVINEVDAVVEAPQFQLFLAISRRPVAKQLLLHFSSRMRCNWDLILAGDKSQTRKTNPTPTLRSQAIFAEVTTSRSPPAIGLRRNR